MAQKYFGFTFQHLTGVDHRMIAAMFFLARQVSTMKAKELLESLDKGEKTLFDINHELQEHTQDSPSLDDLDEFEKELLGLIDKEQKTSSDSDLHNQESGTEDFGPLFAQELTDNRPSFEWFHRRWKNWTQTFGESPSESDYQFLRSEKSFLCDHLPENMYDIVPREIHSPRDMANYVKQFVIGQDHAIEQLSVSFFQHFLDVKNDSIGKVKQPVLLMGATGTGKSEIIRRFVQLCDCPIVRINTNDVVPTSWRGAHIGDHISSVMREGYDENDMQKAVIVFHEFDKLSHKNQRIVGSNSCDFDIDMMREIMRLFETGHPLRFKAGEPFSEDWVTLPTDNMLIVFDGAFHGLSDIIRKRLQRGTSQIGFGNQTSTDETDWLSKVGYKDLIEWGFFPELLGRIGQIIPLSPLSEDTIVKIMHDAKESVFDDHRAFCNSNHIELDFSEGALRLIARQAFATGLGFRSVKTLLARVLNPVYYNIDISHTSTTLVHIDSAFVARQLGIVQSDGHKTSQIR